MNPSLYMRLSVAVQNINFMVKAKNYLFQPSFFFSSPVSAINVNAEPKPWLEMC